MCVVTQPSSNHSYSNAEGYGDTNVARVTNEKMAHAKVYEVWFGEIWS